MKFRGINTTGWRFLAIASGAALTILAALPGSARAQYFTDVSATGSGSGTAGGFFFPTQTTVPDQTESFTGVNTGITVGSLQQVWAQSSNIFTESPTQLFASVSTNDDWVDSSSGSATNWDPQSHASATVAVSFEVAITGAYKLDPVGAGSFSSSQEVQDLQDSVSVTGGGLSLTWSSPFFNPPANDVYILDAGVQYMFDATCSSAVAGYEGDPPIPNGNLASLTVTAVPEPASIAMLATASLLALRRTKRRISSLSR